MSRKVSSQRKGLGRFLELGGAVERGQHAFEAAEVRVLRDARCGMVRLVQELLDRLETRFTTKG